jgi:hypothetical protein
MMLFLQVHFLLLFALKTVHALQLVRVVRGKLDALLFEFA